ncbi:MAG TPA: group II truncated hemoglobin [Polyangiaceae bacterium]
MSEKPPELEIPFDQIGGEAPVRALVERFYDAMEEHEPELAALHQMENGKISRGARDRFALFLIGWLGGPQEYVRLHGHPRLRMRHAHVPVNLTMRDAWLRSMQRALEHPSISANARAFLTAKFADLANFLRNQAE